MNFKMQRKINFSSLQIPILRLRKKFEISARRQIAVRKRLRRRAKLELKVQWGAWRGIACKPARQQAGATRPTSILRVRNKFEFSNFGAPPNRPPKTASPACEVRFEGAMGCMERHCMQTRSKTSRGNAPDIDFCETEKSQKTRTPATRRLKTVSPACEFAFEGAVGRMASHSM